MNKTLHTYFSAFAFALLLSLPMSAFALDIGGMLGALESNLGPFKLFLGAFAYIMGIWFIFGGLFRLKKYGEMRTMFTSHLSIAKPLTVLFAGIALMFMPTMLDIANETFWSQSVFSIKAYPSGGSDWSDIVDPVLDLVRIVGYISFIRAWVLVARTGAEGSPPGLWGKAILHMIGGIMAINIVGTLDVLQATFGLS